MGEMTQEVHSVGSLSPLKSKCVSQAAPVIHFPITPQALQAMMAYRL
uniref:Uncharacterized protein n=1 Tax=Anguilla anguilla TaxID=7936 RepID=A0A0E9SD57_ANGAN